MRYRHTPAVPRYRIIPERSRVDVTARPALPGARIVVDEVSGTVDAGDDGGTGTLLLWLQVVVEDDTRTAGVPEWLRPGEIVAVEGVLESARCTGDHLEIETRFGMDGRRVPFTGAGRVRRPDGPDGPVEAVGITVVDPRSLGFALPPLVTYTLHTRWQIVLVPEP